LNNAVSRHTLRSLGRDGRIPAVRRLADKKIASISEKELVQTL
jgi:predicted site-specific integrase-resolvase